MSKETKRLPFFFIVGRARSGTTLLRCLLDAHPEINIPLECAFVFHMEPKYGKITEWNEQQLISFYHDLVKYPKFHFWSVDKEKLKADLLNCKGNNTYSDICEVVYLNFNSVFPKTDIKLIGDKNPSYSYHIKKLMQLFPEARFIHITRDYRNNIISIINARFETEIYSSLAYRWKYNNLQINKQKNKHPERFYTLRYENLVSQPQFFMKEICHFLDLEFVDEMMNYRSKLDEMLTIYPAELIKLHHKSLLKPINTDNIDDWKHKLTPRKIKICDTVIGSFAEKSGYERMYKKRNLWLYIFCLPGIFYGRLLYVFMNIVNNLPLSLQLKIVHMLARIFNHDWKRFGKTE